MPTNHANLALLIAASSAQTFRADVHSLCHNTDLRHRMDSRMVDNDLTQQITSGEIGMYLFTWSCHRLHVPAEGRKEL
jgi:hypothetical protein